MYGRCTVCRYWFGVRRVRAHWTVLLRAAPLCGQRLIRTQRRLTFLAEGHPPLLTGSSTVLVVVASLYQSEFFVKLYQTVYGRLLYSRCTAGSVYGPVQYCTGYSSRRTASVPYTAASGLLGRRPSTAAPGTSTVLVVVASLYGSVLYGSVLYGRTVRQDCTAGVQSVRQVCTSDYVLGTVTDKDGLLLQADSTQSIHKQTWTGQVCLLLAWSLSWSSWACTPALYIGPYLLYIIYCLSATPRAGPPR